MDIWFTAAGEYGVTAAIAFYLLHRMEKKLDTLIEAVQTWSSATADPTSSLAPKTSSDNDMKQAK